MIAGTLEIQMMADIARISNDMRQAKTVVTGTMQNIESAVGSAKSALAGLGIGLSAGYFVSLIEGSIDAMDRLHDLSLTTSLAVEQLAGLRVAAKQSGGDLESIAGSINKLSVNIGKDSEKFAALGVTAKDPLEAFKQLADVYASLEDPQQRAAVMAAALGKAWAGAAPLLAEGGSKIGEIVERGAKLSGVTKDMADKADALNDKWIELVGTGGLLNSIVQTMLDPLLRLTNQMIAARDGADGFVSTIARFFSIGGDQGKNPEAALAGVNAKLMALRKTADDFAGMGVLKRIFSADDIAIVKAQIATLETQKSMLEGLLGAPFPGKMPATPEQKADTSARASAFLAGSGGAGVAKAAPGMSDHDLQVYANAVAAVREIEAAEKDRQKVAADADAEFGRSMHEFNQWTKNQNNLLLQQAQNWKDLIDPLDPYRRQMAEIDNLYKLNKLSADEWAAAINIVSHNMGEVGKVAPKVDETWRTASKDMQRAMSEGFFDLLTGKTHDFGKAFGDMLAHMVANWLAAKAQMTLFGPDFAKGGDIGGLIGKLLGLGGPSYPTGGMPAGSIFSGMDATDIVLGSFASGTPYVPQTGLYQLHQGERVTQAGGDGPITIINHTTGRIDRASYVPMPNGERAILIEEAVNAIAAQFPDPNSKVSRSMSRSYSVQRSR